MSFVANSILLNVNQPHPNPMTMPICSLGQLLLIACLCNSLLASCGQQQTLRRGSLRSGSRGSGPQYLIHTNYVSTPILCPHHRAGHTQDGSWSIGCFFDWASTVGSPSLAKLRILDYLDDPLFRLASIFTYTPLSLAIQYSRRCSHLKWSGTCSLTIQSLDRGS